MNSDEFFRFLGFELSIESEDQREFEEANLRFASLLPDLLLAEFRTGRSVKFHVCLLGAKRRRESTRHKVDYFQIFNCLIVPGRPSIHRQHDRLCGVHIYFLTNLIKSSIVSSFQAVLQYIGQTIVYAGFTFGFLKRIAHLAHFVHSAHFAHLAFFKLAACPAIFVSRAGSGLKGALYAAPLERLLVLHFFLHA